MPPRLVASDLDGTLLRSDGTVDDRTRRAIATAEAAGATVVFCTARPHRWLKPLAEDVPPAIGAWPCAPTAPCCGTCTRSR